MGELQPRRLGSYLLDGQLCDQAAVERAVALQRDLAAQGLYRPLGQIIVEAGILAMTDLLAVLRRQGLDLLAATPLFQRLPPAALAQVGPWLEHRLLPPRTVVFHEGDLGDAYCVVVSGQVRVLRRAEDGEVTLAILGPGLGFGEIALLTGEPRAATVRSETETCLLVLPKIAFDRVAAQHPELAAALTRIMGDWLAQGNVHLVQAAATERAYQRFIAEQSEEPVAALVGASRVHGRLQQAVAAAAAEEGPVLILGETGTEKKALALLVHQASRQREQPFLVVDAAAVSIGRLQSTPGGTDPFRTELAQASTLFGHEAGALPFARSRRLGLLQVAAGGAVFVDNIDQLAAGVQQQLADCLESGHFTPLGGSQPVPNTARIHAGSAADLEAMAAASRFDPRLLALLAPRTLSLPPLRRRKKDIPEMVARLLARFTTGRGQTVTGLGRDAYERLMDYDWPGNVEELEVVIRRAVRLAKGPELAAADILIGSLPSGQRPLCNLLRWPPVRRFFHSPLFPSVPQALAAVTFLAIFLLGLFGSQQPDANPALILVWGLWEPAVVLTIPFVARAWCAVCPVGAGSGIISRLAGRALPVPPFLRRHGPLAAAVGLGAVFWVEAAAHLLASPRATALLILAMAGLAAVVALAYPRQTWCRFLCPLGQLVGVLASCSAVEVRANQGICNHDCAGHDCYLGRGSQKGCPLGEAPFALHSNLHCILCGNCIRVCPKGSPAVNLRLPGQELMSGRRPETGFVLVAAALMASQLFRGLAMTGLGADLDGLGSWLVAGLGLGLCTLLVAAGLLAAGPLVFHDLDEGRRLAAGRLVTSLVPLAAAFEMGFHLERLLAMAGRLPSVAARSLGWPPGLPELVAGPVLVHVLQLGLVGAGALAAALLIPRTGLPPGAGPVPARSRWPAWLLGAAYAACFLLGSSY
ncbi:MAG: sigma 54-interacting transcriptional regulator [Thermodesulfobacteriota bacterium]